MTNKLKVVFLGTNGWYDTETGNTISILIETPNEYVILDAGLGIYKLDRYIKTTKPIYLFISHFHLDHLFGLHVLAKFKFKQGLNIIVKPGMKKTLKFITARKFTAPLDRLSYRVRVWDIKEARKLKFFQQALLLRHPVPCLGFRFNFGGKIISYVADTGECDNAYRLAQGADLLISECAYKDGREAASWPHLDPKIAAKIARQSGAKKLVLVHFDAEIYQTMAERSQAEKIARRSFPATQAAQDDDILIL